MTDDSLDFTTADQDPGAPPELRYTRREKAAADRRQDLERRSRVFSLARFLTFGSAVLCLLAALVQAGAYDPAWLSAAAFLLVVFIALVPAHDRLLQRQRRWALLERINAEGRDRLTRAFDRLPAAAASEETAESRPMVRDLALFGPDSLFKLLSTAATPPGRSTLADWLLSPAPPTELERRQEAVRELAQRLDQRQSLQAEGRQVGETVPDPESFLSWAESESWLDDRRWLSPVVWALTGASLTTFVGYGVGWWPIHIWLLVLLANFGFSFWMGAPVQELFGSISSREGKFSRYAAIFRRLEAARFDSPAAAEEIDRLSATGLLASRETGQLHRLVELSHLRHSSLHGLIQAVTLWDFHLLARIESWQHRCGRHARDWFSALGRIEALASLAGLSFDNPDWTFPHVDPSATTFEAQRLAHPLLPPDVRVANDVAVGPPDTFLLLTGSNMSGKSTLLRAIGTNVILAQAGGPVCASSLRMPPLELGTSILIEDSLTDGVSFFMAELRRLQTIVARAHEPRQGSRLIFLLDEILRGTNTAERRIAVRKVLLKLLSDGAIGAVSTHDLEVAEIDELATASRPMHFRETLHDESDGEVMTFDYKLRPGLATTANAIRLLRLVGLDDDKPEHFKP